MPSIRALVLMLCLFGCFSGPAFAQSSFSYHARIQCGSGSVTYSEYFSAKSDLEARNEVMRLLNHHTGYRGKGCQLIELNSDAAQNRHSSNSYEVRIQCAGSNSGSTHYFSASSDLMADNEARRILNNHTGYRGKNCQVTEMRVR